MMQALGRDSDADDGDDDAEAAAAAAAPPAASAAAAAAAPPTVRTDGASGPAASTAWLPALHRDWRRRLAVLLGRELATTPPALALALLADGGRAHPLPRPAAAAGLATAAAWVSAHDLARLDAYVRRAVDVAVVADLLPAVATAGLVAGGVPVTDAATTAAAAASAGGGGGDGAPPPALLPLSLAQAAVLAAVGLQRKTVDTVAGELGLPGGQVLALLHKAVRKVAAAVRSGREAAAAAAVGAPAPPPHARTATQRAGGVGHAVGGGAAAAAAGGDGDSDGDVNGDAPGGGSGSDGEGGALKPALRQYTVPAVGGAGGVATAAAVAPGSVVSGGVKRRRIGGGGGDAAAAATAAAADAAPTKAAKKGGGGKKRPKAVGGGVGGKHGAKQRA